MGKFSVTQGQVTPKQIVLSGPKSNLSESLCLNSSASLKKIQSKMKVLGPSQHFSQCKSVEAFGCHGNQGFWSNLSQNIMQPFPHPNDATKKKLIMFVQLSSEIFNFESVNDERQTIAILYAHLVSLLLRWAKKVSCWEFSYQSKFHINADSNRVLFVMVFVSFSKYCHLLMIPE